VLLSLHVRDFAIVHEISVDFAAGMTVLTGETGAGKSILVDSLALVLGERGSAQSVRQGAKRAEFSAGFDLSDQPAALAWLAEQEMDDDNDCVVRRIISSEGRSKAFINGHPVPLAQLKRLGEMLLDIHGQHFHQSLGRRAVQKTLLDHYAGLTDNAAAVEQVFSDWLKHSSELEAVEAQASDRASRIEFIDFQLEEFERLSLEPGELEDLEAEHRRLMNSGKLAEGMTRALAVLSDADTNASHLLAESRRELETLADVDADFKEALELVKSAEIQVSEASDAVNRLADGLEADPERQHYVEGRLDAITTIARKHRIPAASLIERREELETEREALSNATRTTAELTQQVEALRARYDELAVALSKQRVTAAKRFSKDVTAAMDGLGMPGGRFEVNVARGDTPRATGLDDIEFLISANPGQKPMPLSKVASGGELARMSLAIQVIASDGSDIPTMIFDEVDSGVGGGVAEMVGLRLAQLGADRQVLCVTHLPQVASLAHHHLRVSKVSDGKMTRTGIAELKRKERIDELARMLGGVSITQKTLAHATELLDAASDKREQA